MSFLRSSSTSGAGLTSDRTRQRLVRRLRRRGISNERVLDAIGEVPRHLFIDSAIQHRAYEDHALPIGHRQTISQPYVVALMTQAIMDVEGVGKVLEIGTGCGYQTSVLAKLVDFVYSIERIEPLVFESMTRMRQIGIRNTRIKFGDGNEGWEEYAPFDAVIVTAATPLVPDKLKAQVREGGRIVIPVGGSSGQELFAIDLHDGEWKRKLLEYVVFVPMLAGTQQI